MAEQQKERTASVRQSVTIPEPLATVIRRAARQRRWTMSQAVVAFAERGIRAETEAKRSLRVAHQRFLDAPDEAARAAAGRDLIRAVFGEQAVADDPKL